MRSDNSNRAAPARGFMALFAALIMAAAGSASAAPTETVLYAFTGGGSDGGIPLAALIADSSGNLYGTTAAGGVSGPGCFPPCGVVFKLAPGGTETVLHAFTGGSDGLIPFAGLIADSAGNLYGTTIGGGSGCSGQGCGVVFKVSPGGTETVLYSFCSKPSCSDGRGSVAGLIADSAGNLYGTTQSGGGGCFQGCGVVFKLAPGGAETVLYSFTGASDGAGPAAGLIADSSGNLYGTTSGGGAPGCGGDGCGVPSRAAATGVFPWPA